MDGNMKKVQCEYTNCGRFFASRHNLRRHVASHHMGIRRHECDICYASFTSKQNLNVHKYRHRRTETGMNIPPGVRGEGFVESIPKLTDLVFTTKDPDIRPFTTILRVYAYPATLEVYNLPLLGVVQGNFRPLPSQIFS